MSIGLDGSVAEIDDARADSAGQYEFITGERLRFDGGDWFLVSPQGQQPESSRRITTGTLISRSPTAVFVNECDAARVCGYSLIDVEARPTPSP